MTLTQLTQKLFAIEKNPVGYFYVYNVKVFCYATAKLHQPPGINVIARDTSHEIDFEVESVNHVCY